MLPRKKSKNEKTTESATEKMHNLMSKVCSRLDQISVISAIVEDIAEEKKQQKKKRTSQLKSENTSDQICDEMSLCDQPSTSKGFRSTKSVDEQSSTVSDNISSKNQTKHAPSYKVDSTNLRKQIESNLKDTVTADEWDTKVEEEELNPDEPSTSTGYSSRKKKSKKKKNYTESVELVVKTRILNPDATSKSTNANSTESTSFAIIRSTNNTSNQSATEAKSKPGLWGRGKNRRAEQARARLRQKYHEGKIRDSQK
ncbi:unnamed protein product [Thelazia callipaeda]|uniref:SRP40_C domain-containing protein n=1 Tax=Thelazia callipaeda TaxID=103827 RepID=A0A0N5D789_THECL|nr:unnamed protein product [Thelazia callipaeda]